MDILLLKKLQGKKYHRDKQPWTYGVQKEIDYIWLVFYKKAITRHRSSSFSYNMGIYLSFLFQKAGEYLIGLESEEWFLIIIH